jgi:ubiquinone/menaquinone biosynthesis C-methylase UbiE
MSIDLHDIADYWDAAAPAFDDEPDHGLRAERTRLAWSALLTRCLPAGGPQSVLDVGCGTGSLALESARLGHRVTGVDLAPAMVARAAEKLAAAGLAAEAEFLVGDAAEPPTGEQTYDVVLARHLLWTLPSPGDALRAWVRRTRPGGRLVLIEGRWAMAEQTTAEQTTAEQTTAEQATAEQATAAAQAAAPYVPGAERLPWGGGVGAEELAAALRPLVAEVRVEDLSADPDLWGRQVADERYALVAHV